MSPAIKVLCKAPVGDNFNHSYIARECTGCPKKQKDARSQMVDWKSYIYNMVSC